jgi:hypothetical protein
VTTDAVCPLTLAIELVVLLTIRLQFVIGDLDDDPTARVSTRDLIREAQDFIRDMTN